jgi:hypothetical protein
MEGLLASVVLIAILLGVLLVVGGLGYLVAHRLAKRSPEPVRMGTRPLPGGQPAFAPARGPYPYSPASPEGHAVGVMAIAAAAYLAQAGQVLASVVVVATMVIIVFLMSTAPGAGRECNEFHARRGQPPGPQGHWQAIDDLAGPAQSPRR